jgi:hypothetical protein
VLARGAAPGQDRGVLIRRPVLDEIAAGTVTALFRRWDRPRVRVGGTQRTPVGVLEFTAVQPVAASRLTAADARAGGFPTIAALRAAQKGSTRTGAGRLYRITVRLAGEDPRIALRERAALDDGERAEIAGKLERMDRRGPWTGQILRLIGENEGVRAPDLAAGLGRETLPFKRDVRKLKELGLTESLEVGYRLSPRGRAYLRLPAGARPSPRA